MLEILIKLAVGKNQLEKETLSKRFPRMKPLTLRPIVFPPVMRERKGKDRDAMFTFSVE